MNNLSLFIYFAELFGKLPDILITLCVLWSLFVGFNLLIRALGYDSAWGADAKEKLEPGLKKAQELIKPTVIMIIVCVFIAWVVPNKQTMYLIAASEAGETVVETPEGQQIMDDLKEILQIQLQKLKE